ncbi:MAG: glycosyltransferase family A protein [Ilumatobacter sp.]|uniref:glycosyltransferase n=1 Tax=Ilumatobacter sp. TaxID=1967498 RepID=UPI00329A55A7
MTTQQPPVSAIICTRNRADKIRTAVESVLANEYEPFDLTIVDQSTDGLTRPIVESIMESDGRVRYVPMTTSGLSKAYNRGISETTSEILAFTDDDCIAPSEWLDHVVTAFENDPEADLLYGQVVAAYPDNDGVALTPYLMIDKAERLKKGEGFRVFGMGANYAARRRLFDSIGGFDEVLGGGGPLKSSQDFDLAYRAFAADHVIALRPEVVMRHDGRRESEDWPTLLTAYGFGDGAFYAKHVRCRDPYATWLFARRFASQASRFVVKRALRRPAKSQYVTGMIQGFRGSFEFQVDRTSRMYVDHRASHETLAPQAVAVEK